MNTNTKTSRLYFIDNLRALLIMLVIAHHAGQAYGPTGGAWPITNPVRSWLLGPFFSVNAAFFMGLLFLISGYFVARSYNHKGAVAFLKGRFTRLGIPLLIFVPFVFGPIAYVMLGQLPFGAFVAKLYESGWNFLYWHLWFLGHLLVYSTGYVVWREYIRRRTASEQTDAALPTHWMILGFVVALALVTWIVRIWYPIDRWAALLFVVPAEIAHLPQYVSLFIIGTMAYHRNWFRTFPTVAGIIWLWIGLTAVVAFAVAYYAEALMGVRFLSSFIATGGPGLQSLVWSVWETLLCVGLCIGLLVLFREYWNGKPGKLLTVIGGAAYGAYIIHLLVVIGIQAGLYPVALPPFIKFLLVSFAASVLSFGIGHGAKQLPGARRVL